MIAFLVNAIILGIILYIGYIIGYTFLSILLIMGGLTMFHDGHGFGMVLAIFGFLMCFRWIK